MSVDAESPQAISRIEILENGTRTSVLVQGELPWVLPRHALEGLLVLAKDAADRHLAIAG